MGFDLDWLRRRDVLVKDSSRVRDAVEVQNRICDSVSEAGDLSGEVRKWRDKRK